MVVMVLWVPDGVWNLGRLVVCPSRSRNVLWSLSTETLACMSSMLLAERGAKGSEGSHQVLP